MADLFAPDPAEGAVSEPRDLFGARQPPPAPELPEPASERFAPLRAGIVNLWQYDEQELRFEQGRLLLRGDNGTGKSKALELLLPFLLDADLSPQRLDPFASTARNMSWNLLMGDRYESRVGYVWLELARRRDGPHEVGKAGSPNEHWTLGCGLRATRRSQRVDSWYFVTRLRVGDGLDLLSENRVPRLKDELRQRIGDAGTVYDTGREYRERVDQLFFGLGEERFAALRHLLLQLRRPQLSQKLDPRSLGELLTESLPPVERDLVVQLSESFERLDRDQAELARVEAAAAEVEGFVEVYREHARGVLAERSAAVRRADSRYHKTAGEAREAERLSEREAAREREAAARREEVRAEATSARGARRALEASEAMRSAELLREKRERAAADAGHAEAAAHDLAGATEAVEAADGERSEAAAAERRAEDRRAGREEEAREAAAAAGLEASHRAAAEAFPEAETALATARAAAGRRREAVAELRELRAQRDRAATAHDKARDRATDAEARWRRGVELAAEARSRLEAARGELNRALGRWHAGLEELALDEEGFERLAAAALATGAAALGGGEDEEPSEPDLEPPAAGSEQAAEDAGAGAPAEAAALLARLAQPQVDARVRELAELEATVGRLEEERRETAAERARVAEARDLGPEPPRTRAAEDRAERPGAPLYLLTDFAASLPEAERPGLEAALEAAGLLDAWVAPSGRLLAPGTLDTVLVPAPRAHASTLAEVLEPIPGHGVAREVIEAVLRSVDLAEEAAPAPGAAPDETGERATENLERTPNGSGERTAEDLERSSERSVEDREQAARHRGSATTEAPGTGPAATGAAGKLHRVGRDGSFRLGPLRGRWTKGSAEHVGASAREAARRRRLAELDARLEALAAELAAVRDEHAAREEALEALHREVEGLPSVEPVRGAAHELAAAERERGRLRADLAAAETAAETARRALDAAEGRLGSRAREVGLTGHLGDLAAYLALVERWSQAFTELAHAVSVALAAAGRRERAEAAFAAVAERRELVERRAAEAAAAARRARAEAETLEATAGAEARQVVAEHERVVARLAELERQADRLDTEREAAGKAAARAEAHAERFRAELETLEAERAESVEALRRLAETELLALCLGEDGEAGAEGGEAAPDAPALSSSDLRAERGESGEGRTVDAGGDGGGQEAAPAAGARAEGEASAAVAGGEDAATTSSASRAPAAGSPPEPAEGAEAGAADGAPRPAWTLTRALELAREIDRATAGIDLSEDAVARRSERLYRAHQRLSTDLGAEYRPSLRQEADVTLVRVVYNGREHHPASLAAVLRETAEVRRGMLADHEREQLRRFLLGDVGDHLRSRLREAARLVDAMNDQLGRCATASGMVLRLAWRPDAEADPEIREAVRLLLRDPALLPDAERRRLAGFFQRRLGIAREEREAVPWRVHLLQALDYRRWHGFTVQRRDPGTGSWIDLTRHGHAAISGGEKAVALHLPLFAAAAAHYGSARPSAPRIVLLDEAFAGIDQGMRGRCMGLLVDFDLDFLMTSHEEWGCYEELPGLAVYQLYRDPSFDGVAAVPFVWNGERLSEGAPGGARA